MRILIIEDDQLTIAALSMLLSSQSYAVEVATDGQVGRELAEAFNPDLILLDVLIPKLDGISLCKQLRSQGHQMPILLLTGKDSSHDKAIGLDAGADDYVAKPFDTEELSARIRALLRRGTMATQPILEWGELQLDPSSCEASYAGNLLPLTRKEYALLELFLRNTRRVFSCGVILEQIWSFEEMPGEEAVRTHIKGLRQKLKAVGAPTDLIETVYGIGYRLKPGGAAAPTAPEPGEQIRQQTMTAIAGVWERFKDRVSQQVGVIEQATTALLQHRSNPELCQQAEREAHTLAGSLGTFGLSDGSHLARKLERSLQADPVDAKQLHKLVTALRREIERPLSETQGQTTSKTALKAIDGNGRSDHQTNPSPDASSNPSLNQQNHQPGAASLLSYQALSYQQTDSVMIVDDDPQILATLETLLEPWGLRVTTLDDPRQTWQVLEATSPDLLILDIKMPYMSGIELCQAVRNDPRWGGLPVMILTAHLTADIVNQVFAVGADDFVSKPIVGPELVTRIINRLERIRLLRRLAETDPLTGVANRYRSTQDLNRFLSLAKRYQQPLCLAVLDVDQFKHFVDRYGHTIADTVLHQFGQWLLQAMRSEDIVARWSGEQFLVGLYGMTQTEAIDYLMEKMARLQQHPMITIDQVPLQVTVSAGVAQYPEDGADLQVLYQAAATALSQAKQTGGDRVVPAGAASPPSAKRQAARR
jgi:diguanylate cyclase (GGDEF)-like protein